MELSRDVDLLLIGKTGNGKSALGNTILSRKAFVSKNSQNSVTKDVASEVTEFDNRIIKVVDGPGIGDTRMNSEKSKHLFMSAMEYAISANTRGYHAFLLVTKFGGRFTAEDEETISFLKVIFGENFVKNFCILVLTCGDNFDNEDNNMTFKEWCDEQTGVFKQLLEECCHRVILFDNRTKDEVKKKNQLIYLLEMVDNLRWRDLRYTDENFQKARAAREKLMVEAKEPMVREETVNETSLIIQKLQWLQENVEPEERSSHLENLQERSLKLYKTILEQDQETGALNHIIETARSIKVTISNEIEFLQRIIKERAKIDSKIETAVKEFQKTLEEEKKRQKNKLDVIYNKFKADKEENDKSIFRSVVEFLKWPFRIFS